MFLWHRLQPVDSSTSVTLHTEIDVHPFATNQIKRYISLGQNQK